MYEIIKEKSKKGYVIPEVIDDALCSMLSKCYGIAAKDKVIVSSYSVSIRQEIKTCISKMFTSGKTNYENCELFYALYYLPMNLYKIWVPLTDLLSRRLLKEKLCALELGCGPGTSTFGLLEFYREMALINLDKQYRLEINVVEKQKEFLVIFKNIWHEYLKTLPENLKVSIKYFCAEITADFTFLKDCKFDLIFASNMFNANEKFGDNYFFDCCKNLKSLLEDNSSMIFIEPGEQKISGNFKKLRNAVELNNILHIFSPCCCHFQQKHIRCEQFAVAHIRNIRSSTLDFLSKIGIAPVQNGIHSFDYVVFRNDSLSKYEPTLKKRTKLCDIDWTMIGKRVNVTAGILSVNVTDEKVGLQLCDGTLRNKVWLNLSANDLSFHKIDIDMIRGEKIDLKGAIIADRNKLSINNNTEMEVIF